MARTYTAEVLVLKKVNFNEADRLITFLSRYRGKFTAAAKGVRKIASRRSPNLELFNHVKAHFAAGKNFDVVTEVETIHTFRGIKNNLEKTGNTFYLLEVTSSFLADGQGDKDTFDLVVKTLHQVEEAKGVNGVKKALRAFEIRFLEKVGLRPQLGTCLNCKEPIINQEAVISPQLGGVLHSGCALNTIFTRSISERALKTLRFLYNRDGPEIKRLMVSKEIEEELESTARFYLEYLLEKKLKSGEFLLSLKKFPRQVA